MFSYAGVWLGETKEEGAELAAWIESAIKPSRIFPLAYHASYGEMSNGPLLNPTPEEPRPIRTDTLFWPWGASRFARAHFVASGKQVELIRKEVFLNNTQIVENFAFDDGDNSIQAEMWMLPCIPLSKAVSGLEMYLVTLVDERYFWWGESIDLTVSVDATTWDYLYTTISNVIGYIDVDPIPTEYGTPTLEYQASSRLLPPVLDAIAFSVQQRIVRDFDGTIKAQNAATALAAVTANRIGYVPYAGGCFDLNPRK